MAASSKITIVRGDDVSFTTTFTDADGSAIDITGYTVFFTVKEAKRVVDDDTSDSAAIITKDVTSHSDPTAGVTIISLTDTQTNVTPGEYVYDLQLNDGSDGISSTESGIFEVLADVTRRIA